jgi:glyoxylase-like metal-dependent hydrolase (beta-lactamase superfamily II)
MVPVEGTIDVRVPIDVLWESFTHGNDWPRWNKCFWWVKNRALRAGDSLIWVFQPIKWYYPYKMPAIAKIVECVETGPARKVTWQVTAFPGMYARHTYHMEDLGNGRTRFGSWEQGMGWGFRAIRKFWISHFTFVKDRSLQGAQTLERVHLTQGALDDESLPRVRRWPLVAAATLLLAAVAAAGWFYTSYMRLTSMQLAPGIYAIYGGGGNSLVVQSGRDVLLVDTKFPPGSVMLRRWIARNVRAPVTQLVNTHYHYDHTQGNALYPGARIAAYESVPAFMRADEAAWSAENPGAIPTQLVGPQGARLQIGSIEVDLIHPPVAHTRGDLVVYVPSANLVATGDLLFHTYYAMFDTTDAGASIPGIARALRELADQHPDARFLPGHGPLARAADLRRYAQYLSDLDGAVNDVARVGGGWSDALRRLDASRYGLSIIPSFHGNRLHWATAANDVRWAWLIHARDVPRVAGPRAAAVP